MANVVDERRAFVQVVLVPTAHCVVFLVHGGATAKLFGKFIPGLFHKGVRFLYCTDSSFIVDHCFAN